MGLKDKFKSTPELPGVYLLKDREGKIVYVGKASNLRERLCSYLSPQTEPRKENLVKRAEDLDFIITDSTVEALILEENLIKLNKPRYNVRLKDDKKYPYLKITVHEEYPRIFATRNLKRDGSILFGPYTSMKSLKKALKGVKRIFKIRTCRKRLPLTNYERPCLNFQLDQCIAPCQGDISPKEYKGRIDEVVSFLSGKSDYLEKEIELKMWKAVKKENFEEAAHRRDQLLALRHIRKKQKIVFRDRISRDIIGLSQVGQTALCMLFKVRDSKLVAKEEYELLVRKGTDLEEMLSSLLRIIYTHTYDLPQEILVPVDPQDKEAQVSWFAEKRGKKVRVYQPKRGQKRHLLNFARRNVSARLKERTGKERINPSVLELMEVLHLSAPPRRIEGIDISNIQGKQATGSIVVFYNGRPRRSEYRKFRIRSMQSPDDYAMIREVMRRRFRRQIDEHKGLADLILVDGGKGQLSSVMAIVKEFHLDIPVLAFAKRTDQLFFNDGRVISMPATSLVLRMLQHIRNESHRFAITYHRKLRVKAGKQSILDSVRGIGEKRKIALIQQFGSIERLKNASKEEISKTPGIGEKFAIAIHDFFHP